jgi:hypothetical protein
MKERPDSERETPAPTLPDLPAVDVEKVLEEAAASYLGECRTRVRPFVDRHFSLAGAVRLHRVAVGGDLLRAPANLALAIPQVALRLAELGARRARAETLAGWLEGRDLLLRTAVDREVEWLVHTELLRLPIRQPGRDSMDDGLIDALLAHPKVQWALAATAAAIAPRSRDPEFRRRLADNLRRYASTRAAAADIATAITNLGIGWALCHQLTPTALSLGPLLANYAVQSSVVASFPLGPALGGAWYGMFPVSPGAGLVAGMTGGLLVGISAFAAFSGVVTDPIQRMTGIHRRRLGKLLDALEADLAGAGDSRFAVRAHYLARLVDVFDWLRIAYRLAR